MGWGKGWRGSGWNGGGEMRGGSGGGVEWSFGLYWRDENIGGKGVGLRGT